MSIQPTSNSSCEQVSRWLMASIGCHSLRRPVFSARLCLFHSLAHAITACQSSLESALTITFAPNVPDAMSYLLRACCTLAKSADPLLLSYSKCAPFSFPLWRIRMLYVPSCKIFSSFSDAHGKITATVTASAKRAQAIHGLHISTAAFSPIHCQ